MNKQEFLAMSLPHGLHCEISNKKVCYKLANYTASDYTLEFNDKSVICTPILHPLSDLTKEIEHKGEKFVPIVELAKLEGLIPSERIAITADGDIRLRLMLDPENKRSLTPVDFILDITECVFKIQCTTWHSMQVKTQREMQKKLLEWHFDIADLISKGEAIDVNRLPENPYK